MTCDQEAAISLLAELERLRRRVAELEATEQARQQAESARRRVEELLRQNMARYQRAQRLGHVGNWEYNPQTTEFWGSEEAKRIYGFDPDTEHFTTEEVERCIPEREWVHQALVDLLERDAEYNIEFDIITQDTHERRTIVSLADLERDAEGRPLRVTGVIQDVTARKQVDAALRQSEAKFRALFEELQDGVALTCRGIVVEANQQMANLLGLSDVRELIGRSLLDFMTPASRTLALAEIQKLRDGRAQSNIQEFTYSRPDRSTVTVESRGSRIELGGQVYGLSVHHDITEHKQLEAALRKSQESYYSFISQSHEAIYCTEFDQPIDTTLPIEEQIDEIYRNAYMGECNQAMAAIYGLAAREDLIDRRMVDFHGGSDNPVNRATFRQFIQAGYRSQDCETQEITPQGERRFFLSNDVGIVENGRLLRIWGTSLDITRRKQAEAQIRQALAEKEALLRELHHRTRNNMQVVLTLLELQAALVPGLQFAGMWQAAQKRIRAMAMVYDMLYDAPDLSSIDLGQYVARLARTIWHEHPFAGRHIQLILDVQPIPVLFDTAIPCGLALNELLTNALEHAFPGGRDGRVEVSVRRVGQDELELCVADNGVGLPPGLDVQSSDTLGMQIIFSAVEHQLQGQVEFQAEAGLTCRVRLKDSLYTRRV